MDTNNNSSVKTERDSPHHESEQSLERREETEENEDQDRERIELYVKYDASDMLGQESGTQTPIEDEPQGSEEANEEKTDATNNTNNESGTSPGGVIRVQESEVEGSESIEIELEEDNSLLLTSLTSLFPDATGLKYRHPETNTLRGVKLADGKFIEPTDGWSAVPNYMCVFNRVSKRKNEEDDEEFPKKQARTDPDKPFPDGGSDLIVLGIPWATTEDSMKNYFEQYGEVVMVQVKTDPKSGKSRGFGFVRFAKSSIQNKLLYMRHFIDGRWCDVKVPVSKAEAEATKATQSSRKIFVGRLPDNITTDDLRGHFSQYGTLTDVFIPKPFRNFGFVTFGTADMAQSIFKHKHTINGTTVQISEAIPRDSGPQTGYSGNYPASGPSSNPAGGYGAAGYGTTSNSIHPFNNGYNSHQPASHHYHQKNNIASFGSNLYGQNSRKMHPQSTYYPMPSSYGSSGASSSVDTASYVNHNAHADYGSFGGATSGYSQQASSGMNGQYYKMQQQPVMAQNQTHSTYPNQSSYSGHGTNFSRSAYGSVWK